MRRHSSQGALLARAPGTAVWLSPEVSKRVPGGGVGSATSPAALSKDSHSPQRSFAGASTLVQLGTSVHLWSATCMQQPWRRDWSPLHRGGN